MLAFFLVLILFIIFVVAILFMRKTDFSLKEQDKQRYGFSTGMTKQGINFEYIFLLVGLLIGFIATIFGC